MRCFLTLLFGMIQKHRCMLHTCSLLLPLDDFRTVAQFECRAVTTRSIYAKASPLQKTYGLMMRAGVSGLSP